MGKIPLTNDELIRAPFLRRTQSAQHLDLKIAYEWDVLEKGLQRNDFWCFLSNDTEHRGNRIGYLFDLIARAEGMEHDGDPYATFSHFSKKLGDKKADPEKEWLAVKQVFMLLDEWFEDRQLYHLVGFLIWRGTDVNILPLSAKGRTKDVFRETLRQKIFVLVTGVDELAKLDSESIRERITDLVAQLEYGANSLLRIRSILLLFNLGTLLLHPKSNMRFQFENFKTEVWEIEHVRSVASDRPETWKGQVDWLKRCFGYLKAVADVPKPRSGFNSFSISTRQSWPMRSSSRYTLMF